MGAFGHQIDRAYRRITFALGYSNGQGLYLVPPPGWMKAAWSRAVRIHLARAAGKKGGNLERSLQQLRERGVA